MDERIEILLRVNDQASRVLLRFANQLERSTRQAARAQDGLSDSTKKSAAGMRKANAAARRLTATITRLDRRTSALGASFRNLFLGISGFVILRGAIRTMAEFEQTMLAVGAVLGRTQEDIEPLIDRARELGATTRFTANQAAEAILNLSRAGFSMAESLSAAGPALDLAVSGFLDLGTSASIIVSSIRQFGLSAQDAAAVADILVKAANSANVTVTELGESLKLAGPIARQAGVSLQDTAAALGVLGDAGLRGTLAGTGLRRVLIGLIGDSDKTKNALEDLGLSLDSIDLNGQNLVQVLRNLREANIGVSEAVDLFSIRGAPAILVLKDLANVLEEDIEALKTADGEARRVSETIEQSLFGAIRRATAAIQEFVLAAGDSGARGALRGLFEGVASLFRVLADYEGATERASTSTLALASTLETLPWIIVGAGALKFVGILIRVATAARAATGAMGTLNAVVRANPWAALAVAVTGAVFAYNALSESATRAGAAARRARLDNEDFAKSVTKIQKSLNDLISARTGRGGDTPLEISIRVQRALRTLISDLSAAKQTIQGLSRRALSAEEFGKILGFDSKTIEEFGELTKKTGQRIAEEILDQFNFDKIARGRRNQFTPIGGASQFSGIIRDFGTTFRQNRKATDDFRDSLTRIFKESNRIRDSFERLKFLNQEQRKAVEDYSRAIATNAVISRRDFVTAIDAVIARLQKQSVATQETIEKGQREARAVAEQEKAKRAARREILENVKSLRLEAELAGKSAEQKRILALQDKFTTLVLKAKDKLSKEEIKSLQAVIPLLVKSAAAREDAAKAEEERREARRDLDSDIAGLEIGNMILEEEIKNGKAAAKLLEFRLRAKALEKGIDEDRVLSALKLREVLKQQLADQRKANRGPGRRERRDERITFGLDFDASRTELATEGLLKSFAPTERQLRNLLETMTGEAPDAFEVFATSFSLRMEQVGREMTDLANLGRSLADGLVGAFEGAFSSFADDVIEDFDSIDKAFRNLAKNLLKNLAKLAFDLAQRQILGGILNALFSGASKGILGGLLGGGGASIDGPNAKTSRQGNIFKGGQIVPFQRGGVVDQFTTFPLAGGRTGSAGEGGVPEAILPLLRGRGGRLGVEVMNPNQLGGGGVVNSNNIIVNHNPTINTQGNREDTQSALRESNRELERLIDTRVAKQFGNGTFRTKVAQTSRGRR